MAHTDKACDNTDMYNSSFRDNKGSQMIERKVMKLQYI